MGKNIGKDISKGLNKKYSHKHVDYARQFATDAFKTCSKRFIQKIAEATTNFIVNKIADQKLPQNNLETNEEILREKYLSPELRQKIIDDLRVMDD